MYFRLVSYFHSDILSIINTMKTKEPWSKQSHKIEKILGLLKNATNYELTKVNALQNYQFLSRGELDSLLIILTSESVPSNKCSKKLL